MRNKFRRIVPLILALCILASIGWYLFVYDRTFTRDVLLSQARYHDTKGNAGIASWFYDMAYTYSGNDKDVAIELANQYKADGNFTKAEVTLSNSIADGGTPELYIALCKTYVEQDKLLDAVNLLENIADPSIKAELDAMRPDAPVADPEPGFYSQYIPVNIVSDSGTLYCNTNGEYPSIEDGAYAEPVTLPAGETTMYAISVADDGLVSPATILAYTVGGVIEPAVFTDAAMEASMRAALEMDAETQLYTNDLWNITSFTVPAEAQSIEDLKLLPYLTTLTIADKQLDSLSPLSSMSKLEELDLSGCRFPSEDLAVLGSLPALTKLTMSNCGLSTVADLANAINLTYLNLSNNTVRNLEALSSMTALTELNLQHNAVTALDALSPLVNLSKLDISYNSVSSLAPLANCTMLSWLDAGNNSISKIEAVENLTAMSYLALNYNSISDITPLSVCTSLKELHVANNLLQNITSLGALSDLEVLDFAYNEVFEVPIWPDGGALRIIDGSHNAVEDISSLWNMENLTYVYMDYNRLTSIGNLGNCPNLVMVNVFGNDISEVSNLTEHDIIVNWDPS